MNGFYSLPKKYPSRIDQTIVDALIELKAETDVPYPPALLEPTRATYVSHVHEITTKRIPGHAGTHPGGS
jgi:hypothetical protein